MAITPMASRSSVLSLGLRPLRPGAATTGAPWGWALGGAALGLIAVLVLCAPARWLAAGVAQASDGRVQLQAARGTVWDGSAHLVLTGGAGSQDVSVLPSRLSWQVRPSGAGMGMGLALTLSAPCCTPAPVAMTLTLQPGLVRLSFVDGPATHWPAGLLAGLGTPWNTLALEGQLSAQTRGLSVQWAADRLQIEGSAALSLADVSSRLATLRPLGSYRVELSGGPTPGLHLRTVEGALQLQGQGQWVGARLRFNGQAEAAPGREAALGNLLNIIGRRNGTRALITLG